MEVGGNRCYILLSIQTMKKAFFFFNGRTKFPMYTVWLRRVCNAIDIVGVHRVTIHSTTQKPCLFLLTSNQNIHFNKAPEKMGHRSESLESIWSFAVIAVLFHGSFNVTKQKMVVEREEWFWSSLCLHMHRLSSRRTAKCALERI